MTMFATVVVPSLSVVSTATVAIWTKIIDAKTKREDRQHAIDMKREDRQHETNLKFEKRFGQDKSNALKPLISAALFVKRRTLLISDRQHQRATAIRALDQFADKLGGDDGIGELLAYAAPPVRQVVDAMLNEIDAQQQVHFLALMNLRQIGSQWAQLGHAVRESKPLPAGVTPGVKLSELRHLRDEAMDEIEREAEDLDVDALVAQCDEVISAAHDDLRGRYGTAESG